MSRRSRSCVRRATTPNGTARWASASTTTSRSPRRPPVPAGLRASPSSTSTSITATGRSGCSTTIRPCSTCRATSFPSIPARAPPTRSARVTGRGFTVNVPLEAGATDADYVLAYSKLVVPVLDQFAPELTLVSAGFDAHEMRSPGLDADVVRRIRGDRRGRGFASPSATAPWPSPPKAATTSTPSRRAWRRRSRRSRAESPRRIRTRRRLRRGENGRSPRSELPRPNSGGSSRRSLPPEAGSHARRIWSDDCTWLPASAGRLRESAVTGQAPV